MQRESTAMESTTIESFHEIYHNDIHAMTTLEKTTSIGVYMGCFDALAAISHKIRFLYRWQLRSRVARFRMSLRSPRSRRRGVGGSRGRSIAVFVLRPERSGCPPPKHCLLGSRIKGIVGQAGGGSIQSDSEPSCKSHQVDSCSPTRKRCC